MSTTTNAGNIVTQITLWLNHNEGLGVWMGSAASFFVAFIAVFVVFLQRNLDRRARLRSLSLVALFKLRAIHSNMVALTKTLERWKNRAADLNLSEPFQYMEPVPNLPHRVYFSSDESEALFLLGDGKLFDDLQLMESFHNSALALLEACSSRRMALTDLLPAEVRDGVGSVEITHHLRRIIEPRSAEITSMMESMVEHWPKDASFAGLLLTRLGDRLKAKLGLQVSLEPAPGLTAL